MLRKVIGVTWYRKTNMSAGSSTSASPKSLHLAETVSTSSKGSPQSVPNARQKARIAREAREARKARVARAAKAVRVTRALRASEAIGAMFTADEFGKKRWFSSTVAEHERDTMAAKVAKHTPAEVAKATEKTEKEANAWDELDSLN